MEKESIVTDEISERIELCKITMIKFSVDFEDLLNNFDRFIL